MATKSITVWKVVNGQRKQIVNPVAAAQIADLLATSPASQACIKAVQNPDFLKLASTGDGEYQVEIVRDDDTMGIYKMSKKNVKAFAESVFQIAGLLEKADNLKTFEGEAAKRGRTALVADFSEV